MPSVKELWKEYVKTQDDMEISKKVYTSWYFCDSEECANELLELVLSGEKRATASALWTLENSGDAIPKQDDISIITNWDGEAKCIVCTTNISITAFNKVTEEFAALEGEGDKSLQYWRDAHWDYFLRELAQYGLRPELDMPIVCETFDVIYKPAGL